MDIKSFLNRIQQIESSGGKNLNHQTITHGLQKGQTAIGRYGLLPNTIDEIVSRQHHAGVSTPEIEALKGMDRDSIIGQFQEHPELEQNLAEYLAKHVLERQKGNEHAAAYAWNHGHNLNPNKITAAKLLTDDYTKKFSHLEHNDEMADMQEQEKTAEERMKEAIQKRALYKLAGLDDEDDDGSYLS